MEPAAPSLTEEDLTEVKKDVSSTAGPGRAGGRGGLRACGRRERKPGGPARPAAGEQRAVGEAAGPGAAGAEPASRGPGGSRPTPGDL